MAARKVVRINRGNNLPVGMTVQAQLTETQFQALNGPSWVLMDGRDVTGSVYAQVTGITVLDDARGLVLRSKNNGRSDGNQNPDGDLALGTFQDQQTDSHNHSRSNAVVSGTGVGGNGGSWVTGFGTRSTSSTGGNETRMRNLTTNTFIKINP